MSYHFHCLLSQSDYCYEATFPDKKIAPSNLEIERARNFGYHHSQNAFKLIVKGFRNTINDQFEVSRSLSEVAQVLLRIQ